MFRPNVDCVVFKGDTFDTYGKSLPGKRIPERCNLVKMERKSVRTTVRADSSATRGAAEELTMVLTILMSPTTEASLGDAVTLLQYRLRITSMRPHIRLNGTIDHYEVEGVIAN